MFGLQKKKNVLSTFIPSLSGKVSKRLTWKIVISKIFLFISAQFGWIENDGPVDLISFPFPPFFPTKLQKNNPFPLFLFTWFLLYPHSFLPYKGNEIWIRFACFILSKVNYYNLIFYIHILLASLKIPPPPLSLYLWVVFVLSLLTFLSLMLKLSH